MMSINLQQYDLSHFKNDLLDFHISLSDDQFAQLIVYYEMLIEWNEKINLTSITEYDEVLKKHFIDSLSIVKAYKNIQYNNFSLIDVGTGAGFPGLVLKIVFPDLRVTLLDSLNKRIFFLNSVIEKLNLFDVIAVHGRAEDFAKNIDYREKFDLCVSRAVANLSTLSEYCLPFVSIGGKFISYKSSKSEDEIQAASAAVKILGGKLFDQVEFNLPSSDIYRNLIVIDKVSFTPKKFPRKAGLPSKDPLK